MVARPDAPGIPWAVALDPFSATGSDIFYTVHAHGGTTPGANMKLPRRKFLHLAAGAAALPAVSRVATAQGYPSRPVTVIVFVPAGGTPDIIARLIGQALSQRLG